MMLAGLLVNKLTLHLRPRLMARNVTVRGQVDNPSAGRWYHSRFFCGGNGVVEFQTVEEAVVVRKPE